VTILEALPQLLPAMDGDAVARLQAESERIGLQISTGVRIERIEASGARFRVIFTLEGIEKAVEADWVVNGAGRIVDVESLGLAAGQVDHDNGRIAIDSYLRFPFAVLCGMGLCVGYALLGACWLVRKCEHDVRDQAYRLVPYLSAALPLFLIIVFVYALVEDFAIMTRWLERPYLFVFPVVGALASLALAISIHGREDALPFPMVAVIFAAAFGTLAISFWPYMIPFSITIEQAAAPHSSLAFMFWGEGLFVFPLMLLYTVISLAVFRGKTAASPDHY
jgi:cytochrome d ubiquinol oxidase subunit II